MSSYTLDASALMAMLHQEPGGDFVRERIHDACISAVNLAEVGSKLVDRGTSPDQAGAALSALGLIVIPFDEEQALLSAALRVATQRRGLSLGDRACLAAAKLGGSVALTADRAWSMLGLDIAIQPIR